MHRSIKISCLTRNLAVSNNHFQGLSVIEIISRLLWKWVDKGIQYVDFYTPQHKLLVAYTRKTTERTKTPIPPRERKHIFMKFKKGIMKTIL